MNTLYTEHLILRPFREDDLQDIFDNWTQDERVARFCRWTPHTSVRDTDAYLKNCMDSEFCWAITVKGSDEPQGCINLVGLNQMGVPEVGYVLAHDHWGRGYATEALKAVIDELFRNGYRKIGACHDVNNPASGRVMEKCGMKFVRTYLSQKKYGSDEQCQVRSYEIKAPKV